MTTKTAQETAPTSDDQSTIDIDRRGARDFLDVFLSDLPLGEHRPRGVRADSKRLVLRRAGEFSPQVRLRALYDFSRSRYHSTQEIYSRALTLAVEHTGSPVGFVAFLNDRGTEIIIPAWSRPTESESRIANRSLVCSLMSADFWADPIELRRPVMVNTPTDEDMLKRHYPGNHSPIRRHLGVPLVVNGRVVAMIGVANKPDDYVSEDEDFLSDLTADLWRLSRGLTTLESLQDSEKRHRLLIETMSEGLAAFNENCNVTFVNSCLCRMLEYTPKQLIGESVAAFMDEANQSIFYEKIALGKEGGLNPYEVELRTHSGSPLPAIVSPQPIFDRNGNFVGSFAVVTDITVQKNAEAELTQTNQALAAERAALTEKNVALKEVLSQIEQETDRVKAQIRANVDRIVMPLVRKLGDTAEPGQREYVKLLERCLTEIASPFISRVEERFSCLSPRELEVCNLIRNGLSSKEIASMLSTSVHTVHNQRKQIRKKLGLHRKGDNLATYLRSLADRH